MLLRKSPFNVDRYKKTESPKDLMNEVAAAIPPKWRAVGYQLSLSYNTLDSILRNHAGKPQACLDSFEEVFRTWKDQATTAATCSPYTWLTMIDALKTPVVGEVALAKSLEQKLKMAAILQNRC